MTDDPDNPPLTDDAELELWKERFMARAAAHAVGWLMKTRGLTEAEATEQYHRAMNAPSEVKLPTMEELDQMPDDPDPFIDGVCLTCKRSMVRWDDPDVLDRNPAIDCGGHCLACMLVAEGNP
jgi:hypothetical protein